MTEINDAIVYKCMNFSSIENIEAIANGIMNETKRAILSNSFESILSELKKLQAQFERIRNKLDLDNDTNRSIYYFGKIASATQLVMDVSKTVERAASFERISHNYPKFTPILLTIADHSVISGKDLRRELKISSGALSNFMKRIDSYHLITVEKVGRENVYSLTIEGRKVVSQAHCLKKATSEAMLPISEVTKMLSAVAIEISTDVPNAACVLASSISANISPEAKKRIRTGIDEVFLAKAESEKNQSRWRSLLDSQQGESFGEYYHVHTRGENVYNY